MASSSIRVTPLSGAYDESPPTYLLQLDDLNILIDCGWNGLLKLETIQRIIDRVNDIDLVLLSYPDVLHLGALPYLVGKCSLKCDVYATVPVYKMGQMFMYDLYQSHQNTEDFQLFSLDDVDAAFELVRQLKYSQSVTLKGKGSGVTITPYPAGHMIGGTMWRIAKHGEEILYAVDYNHKKERHLDCAVLETLSRPTLLITDSFSALSTPNRRKDRDLALTGTISSTLRGGGNVLLVVDTAGRVLELAQLLEQMWRAKDSGLSAYSLALLNNISYNVIEFAKSQMEWMSDKIMRMFEDQRNNPFQFKYLSLCHNLQDLARIRDPKVVLASVDDLECGFSRELFIQWANVRRNCIIMTTRPPPGTLARILLDQPNTPALELVVRKRVELEGEELDEFYRQQTERQKMAREETTTLKSRRRTVDTTQSESDEEMDADDMLTYSTDQRTFPVKSYPLFPHYEEKIKWDEYGEIVNPADYITGDLLFYDDKGHATTKVKQDIIEEEELSEIPTKCVTSKEVIPVNCSIVYSDFEGRSDGDSVRKILNQMKPKQVVIVHGTAEATEHLANFCEQSGWASGRVYAPHVGETVNVTSETHIFEVKLTDQLANSLDFVKAKECELAWIDGQVDINTEALSNFRMQQHRQRSYDSEDEASGMEDDDVDDMATSDLAVGIVPDLSLPTTEVKGHAAVFVNEPRLSDFKQVLSKVGILAEFSGGVLICNNVIAIRRSSGGHLELEGPVCDEFYQIRELLYRQYAII